MCFIWVNVLEYRKEDKSMKLVLRIFNFIIMGIALAATIMLFTTPAFTFNSKIAIDVQTFAKFVPETKYTSEFNIVELIGTDTINVRIKFNLDAGGVTKNMDGKREKINNDIIAKNVDEMADILHEPIDLITDYSIRSVIKSTVKAEITKQVDEASKKYNSTSTAEEIMDEVGMDDAYFTKFSNSLYDSANKDGATIDSVSDVLYAQIDDALAKAEESGLVDNSGFTQSKKGEIQNNLLSVLNELKLVNEDGTLKKISQVSYIYLSTYLKQQLNGKVNDPATLEQKTDEDLPNYTDRLLCVFVTTQMPDMFYNIVSYVSLGLFIGLIVFSVIWIFLFVWTLIRTFTKKPWTFFGPIFWIVGLLQVVLGLGLTVFCKFILPTMKLPIQGLPIKSFIIAPRTYALIPSILYLTCILIAIVYLVFKIMAKKEYKQQQGGQK